MSTGRGGAREPTKIVFINTQYVHTDAMSFKSVVQELTGKDSVVSAAASEYNSRKHFSDSGKNVKMKKEDGKNIQSGCVDPDHHLLSRSNSVLMRDLSFKDLDRLLREMPSVDEFFGSWAGK